MGRNSKGCYRDPVRSTPLLLALFWWMSVLAQQMIQSWRSRPDGIPSIARPAMHEPEAISAFVRKTMVLVYIPVLAYCTKTFFPPAMSSMHCSRSPVRAASSCSSVSMPPVK